MASALINLEKHMIKTGIKTAASLLLLGGALLAQHAQAQAQAQAHDGAREPIVRPRLAKELPDIPGKEALVLTVEFPPGAGDPVHRHDAHGFIYVLEGEIEMAVNGDKPVTLRTGDTFYEGPHDIHTVGRNASKTKRARILAVLVKNTGVDAVLPPK
jgi:quercetin dioxygenase-like cupin family protein